MIMKMKNVTIQSPCYEKAIKFYQEIVGLNIQREIKDKGPCDVTFLANAAGETCIEIADNPDKPYEGKGISIGFVVEDVEGFREKLVTKGLQVSQIIAPDAVTKFFLTRDPNGITIQFMNESSST